MKEYAEKYGKVSEHQIILDKATGKSRGFGFVTFSQKADADAFLEEESHFLDGRTVGVSAASVIAISFTDGLSAQFVSFHIL